jgi:hypothetical protein
MFRNNKVLRNDPIEINDLVLTRSDTFYFCEFAQYTKDLFDSLRVKSKPSVIFYTESSTDCVVLDYSLASAEDKLFLEAFFVNMGVGEAFSLTNGNYVDDTNSVDADVSSSLTFKKIAENLVFAEVVSTTNKDTNVDQYSADFFIGTPQLTKAGSLEQSEKTKIQALVSLNPKSTAKPILFLGYQPGDVIEILCPTSVNNNKKFNVIDAGVINDKEVLYLETDSITTESLIGKPVIINLYQRSSVEISDVSQLSSDQTTLGCCVEAANNIALPYQTQKQCALRGSSFVWTAGSCSTTNTNLVSTISTNITTTTAQEQAAQEVFDKNILLLKNSVNDVAYDSLSSFFKKKIIDNPDALYNENVFSEYFSVTDPTDIVDPFQMFFNDNVIKYSVPVVVDSNTQLKATQAILPGSVFNSIPGVTQDLVTVQTDTNIYKLLNISFEAIITDTDIKVRSFEGNVFSKTEINLSKNILTTLYETNTTGDDTERLLFSESEDSFIPVTDFGKLGYGYIQIGRYHIFTPLVDDIKPLYLISNKNKSSSYSIQGVYAPTFLPGFPL